MRNLKLKETNCPAAHRWQNQDSNPGTTSPPHSDAAMDSTYDWVLSGGGLEALALILLERRDPAY